MEKITSVDELRESIRLLETKQKIQSELLKEQFKITYTSLKPANLIKNSLHELTASPDLKGGLLNAGLSLAAGYLSKKAIIGTTRNPLKNLFGILLQRGVATLVSKNSDKIKSTAIELKNTIFSKKEPSS